MEQTKEFRLNDFYQAAVLKTLGLPLLRLENTDSNFVDFIFYDPESKADKLIQDYWDRRVKCVTRDLIENINELKTRIHSRKGRSIWKRG